MWSGASSNLTHARPSQSVLTLAGLRCRLRGHRVRRAPCAVGEASDTHMGSVEGVDEAAHNRWPAAHRYPAADPVHATRRVHLRVVTPLPSPPKYCAERCVARSSVLHGGHCHCTRLTHARRRADTLAQLAAYADTIGSLATPTRGAKGTRRPTDSTSFSESVSPSTGTSTTRSKLHGRHTLGSRASEMDMLRESLTLSDLAAAAADTSVRGSFSSWDVTRLSPPRARKTTRLGNAAAGRR